MVCSLYRIEQQMSGVEVAIDKAGDNNKFVVRPQSRLAWIVRYSPFVYLLLLATT